MTNKFCATEYKKSLENSESISSCPKVPLPLFDDNQNYIFISYSHKDYKKVYADLADMHEAGVRFWYDKGLPAGKDWKDEVEKKLLSANCAGVLFFMSKDLFLSRSANREIAIVCNRTKAGKSDNGSALNYFSVNLTQKMPIQILSEIMQDKSGEALDMNMISVLCQAFPDSSTYLYYDAVEHKEELISQIKNQFGVICDDNNYAIVRDTSPCSLFIATLNFESLKGRQTLIDRLSHALENISVTTYTMQETDVGFMSDELKNYIEQQNKIKLESAQYVLIVCSVMGLKICIDSLKELNDETIHAKKIFYLIASENYGDKEDLFVNWFGDLLKSEEHAEFFGRVFYDQYSEQKLIEALSREIAK
jgi:hypothetical protein